MSKLTYNARWGHARTRTTKGHPAKKVRQANAYARGGSVPGTKPNPPKVKK